MLVRVDFNVPIKNGAIGDDTRIRSSLPTIEYALEHGARTVILCSHLGRPKGKPDPQYSLKPVADHLATLLERPVVFAEDCIGEPAKAAIERAGDGGVVLLENLRFHAEEEKNDPAFAAELAALADVYVNDAFGSAHRAHASTEGVVRHVKEAAAGLLMAAEIEHLGRVLEHPDHPFVAILGGAKVSDKLEVIQNLVPRVDALLIGGAMAYTFFKARERAGRQVARRGRSARRRARRRGAARRRAGCASSCRSITSSRRSSKPARRPKRSTSAIRRSAIAWGSTSARRRLPPIASVIAGAKTVIWNGPMGVFEIDAFAKGTMEVAQAVADVKGTTVIGGGDSIAAVAKAGVTDRITHISTGGGASLEFLGGRELPGVAALPDA